MAGEIWYAASVLGALMLFGLAIFFFIMAVGTLASLYFENAGADSWTLVGLPVLVQTAVRILDASVCMIA